ncbi:IS3 family transposase [Klebsiella pneumoniae]|uniref:IS3 family transposase n=1 Tax=Klebsiella pneumoniae TaxID=573 RepID=UPI00229FF6BE|nr:IS3 family transposase [Klebsiella pneumoniae]HCT6578026.1 IS3 family transposase [Klebsiella pneumoniae]
MDNSPMERVFKSLKSEWILVGGYSDIRQMMQDITVWIHYYNQHRPHTFNGGLSPYEYENQCKEAGFAPIFPYTFYHLTHYWFAATDIPVANDT